LPQNSMMDDPAEVLSEQVREELIVLDSHVSSRRRQSLPELLRAWSRYADLISSRERIDLDDYRGMLFARDAIQDVVRRATPATGRLLEALVSHPDSLFVFGTRKDDAGVLQAEQTEDRPGWWWGRVPDS